MDEEISSLLHLRKSAKIPDVRSTSNLRQAPSQISGLGLSGFSTLNQESFSELYSLRVAKARMTSGPHCLS